MLKYFQPRWTAIPQEIFKSRDTLMAAMDKGFSPSGLSLILVDGSQTSNLRLVGSKAGNNAGEGGRWAYYGALELEDDRGNKLIIDLLDIEAVL